MDQHRHPNGPLRVTRVRPGLSPEPADSPFAVERLTALTHDLANLLDGSLRCLLLARRSMEAAPPAMELDAARKQIETVFGALQRMAELVHSAMCGAGAISPAAQHWVRRAVTLQESITHAADVLTPEAGQHGVRLDVRIAEDAASLPAGPLYTVLLNGMRNALESIIRAQAEHPPLPGQAGHIEVIADCTPVNAAGVTTLRIEIRDDGRGIASTEDARRALDYGYTTKPGGTGGVGLALARDVVREVGGAIELLPREDRARSTRPGAVLRINYPVVAPEA